MAGGFQALGLLPELLKAIDDLGWQLPTDVQDETIPLILGGGDVMVASETGSGKTAAFCLPILQTVCERLRSANTSTNEKNSKFECDIKLNLSDRDNLLNISDDHLSCYSYNRKKWIGGRATHGIKSGKYYYEATITGNGIARLGWSTMAAHYELGKDNQGYGYGGTGKKSYNSQFDKYGMEYTTNSIVGCYMDCYNHTISYSVDGQYLGIAFQIPSTLHNAVFFPAFVFKNAGAQFNFGQQPFQYLSSSLTENNGYISLYQALATDIVCNTDSEAYSTTTAAAASISTNSSSSSSLSSHLKHHPLAIILEPSRDLAEQVYQTIHNLSLYIKQPSLRIQLLIGGGGGGGSGSSNTSKATHTSVKDFSIYGCDIVVGTIGKIMEMFTKNQLQLSYIRFFILDEADKMTESLPDILKLYQACPVSGAGDNRLQVCFFSATLHSLAISNLASKICVNPTWVDLKGVDAVPETVHHVIYNVDINTCLPLLLQSTIMSLTDNVHTQKLIHDINATLKILATQYKSFMDDGSSPDLLSTFYQLYVSHKSNNNNNNSNNNNNNQKSKNHEIDTNDMKEIQSYLIKCLKQQIVVQIVNKFNMSRCVIFCRTNVDCDQLEAFFNNLGGGKKFMGTMETGKENIYSCCVLGGARTTDERRRNLEAFKNGDVRFLICTDVAARGIDIQELPYVINMTLPDESEQYIHRIGRVGRADRMGLAISIVANQKEYYELVWYHTCSNRGKNCQNRQLVEKGGCTLWYHEYEYLMSIQERLHMTTNIFPSLHPVTYSLPIELELLNIQYGKDNMNNNHQQIISYLPEYHTKRLLTANQELSVMEVQVQNIYLYMHHTIKKIKTT